MRVGAIILFMAIAGLLALQAAQARGISMPLAAPAFKGDEVSVRITVDPAYNLVIEEITVVLEGQAPNLWDDMSSKLRFSKWELNHRLAELLNSSLSEISGGKMRVVKAEVTTSNITRYSKLEGRAVELDIKIWISGAVRKASPLSPHMLFTGFRKLDVWGALEEAGGIKLDMPSLKAVLSRPINEWSLTSTESDSVLPVALQVPTFRASGGGASASLELPAGVVIAFVGRDVIAYYTVGDLFIFSTPILLVLAIIATLGLKRR